MAIHDELMRKDHGSWRLRLEELGKEDDGGERAVLLITKRAVVGGSARGDRRKHKFTRAKMHLYLRCLHLVAIMSR